MEILNTKKSFRREFKRQLRYAIAAAVGFIIAFSWRETIISATRDIVERLTEAAGNIVNVIIRFS